MKAAYADPPYFGCGARHYGTLHADAADYDKLETHARLVERLMDEYDTWALSLHEPSLKKLLAFCPDGVRVAAWVKPFASWKGKGLPHAWEPVLLQLAGERKHRTRDWVSAVPPAFSAGKEKMLGTPGQKPQAFCYWLFDAMTLEPDDEFCDLFPGSGAVTAAWERWRDAQRPVEQQTLLAV